MSWPQIVRSLRLKYGAKQDSLSLLMGVSQATISRWESGRQIPSDGYRKKLLDLYRQHVTADTAGIRRHVEEGRFLVHLDQDLRHLYVDDSIKCYNHRAVDEMLGRHPWEMWLPTNARSRFEEACRRVMATGQEGEFHHSGTVSVYRTRISWMAELKRFEVETRRVDRPMPLGEDDSLAALLMGCKSIGLVKADDRRIWEANDTFLGMIGCDRERLTKGIDWAEITPPEFVERDLRALSDLRRSGEFEPYEKECLHPSGDRVPVLLAGRAVTVEPLVMIATVIDLSRQRPAAP